MKKRILAVVMMLVLALGVVACGAESDNETTGTNGTNETNETTGTELKSEGELLYELPAGFTYDEASECYYGPNYPNELANINYLKQENDGSFDTLTKENIEAALEDGLSQGFGEDIDITITRWDETDVDGYEAVIYSCEYSYMGMDLAQTQIAINGKDNFHYMTFTDFAESDYADDFEACLKSMKFSGVN